MRPRGYVRNAPRLGAVERKYKKYPRRHDIGGSRQESRRLRRGVRLLHMIFGKSGGIRSRERPGIADKARAESSARKNFRTQAFGNESVRIQNTPNRNGNRSSIARATKNPVIKGRNAPDTPPPPTSAARRRRQRAGGQTDAPPAMPREKHAPKTAVKFRQRPRKKSAALFPCRAVRIPHPAAPFGKFAKKNG